MIAIAMADLAMLGREDDQAVAVVDAELARVRVLDQIVQCRRGLWREVRRAARGTRAQYGGNRLMLPTHHRLGDQHVARFRLTRDRADRDETEAHRQQRGGDGDGKEADGRKGPKMRQRAWHLLPVPSGQVSARPDRCRRRPFVAPRPACPARTLLRRFAWQRPGSPTRR